MLLLTMMMLLLAVDITVDNGAIAANAGQGLGRKRHDECEKQQLPWCIFLQGAKAATVTATTGTVTATAGTASTTTADGICKLQRNDGQ
jgi:hypothetical protein